MSYSYLDMPGVALVEAEPEFEVWGSRSSSSRFYVAGGFVLRSSLTLSFGFEIEFWFFD